MTTRRLPKDHVLIGLKEDNPLSVFDFLTEADIWQYRYPDEAPLEQVGVRCIYLGNYVRWDPLAQHLQMVQQANYHSAPLGRTFDVFDHVDDWHYMGLHDWIKQRKHSYGQVLDQACREIRYGRITKQQAESWIVHFQAQQPRNLELLLDWLQLTRSGLDFIISQHARFDSPPHTTCDATGFPTAPEAIGFSANGTLNRGQTLLM